MAMSCNAATCYIVFVSSLPALSFQNVQAKSNLNMKTRNRKASSRTQANIVFALDVKSSVHEGKQANVSCKVTGNVVPTEGSNNTGLECLEFKFRLDLISCHCETMFPCVGIFKKEISG